MIREAIERYEAGAGAPAKAIQGLSAADLDAVPVPGKWSIRQVIVHLMDSDLVGVDRMKRVAAMERPLLIGYDENAFMARLHPERIDAALAAEAFRVNRLAMAAVLKSLPEEAFSRWGIHSERGKETLLEFVGGYAEHLEHHLRFVEEKKRKLGK